MSGHILTFFMVKFTLDKNIFYIFPFCTNVHE